MIFIDSSKCTGCGQCTRVCPFTVLRLNQEGKAENTGEKVYCLYALRGDLPGGCNNL